MFITQYLGVPLGHSSIEFVDINTSYDSKLFIDPCLIERGDDVFSGKAAEIIRDFEGEFYKKMRSESFDSTDMLEHAHEIDDTKLGYGNGRNGKGKTSDGLKDSFKELFSLVKQIPSISRIQDMNVFVPGFAEDSMSDLLTNILQSLLCDFTEKQMLVYGKKPTGFYRIEYWDCINHQWMSEERQFWEIDGTRILLVPKQWVRKNFLFKTHQYLCMVIIEHIRAEEMAYRGLNKSEILKSIERSVEHWKYDKVANYTQCHPYVLEEYHYRMLEGYRHHYGKMSDTELDMATYSTNFNIA